MTISNQKFVAALLHSRCQRSVVSSLERVPTSSDMQFVWLGGARPSCMHLGDLRTSLEPLMRDGDFAHWVVPAVLGLRICTVTLTCACCRALQPRGRGSSRVQHGLGWALMEALGAALLRRRERGWSRRRRRARSRTPKPFTASGSTKRLTCPRSHPPGQRVWCRAQFACPTAPV